MRFLVIAALCATLLGGCATFGQPSAEDVAAMNTADDQACLAYGFKPETDGYAECRLHLSDRRHSDQQLSNEEFAASMRQMSANMNANRSVTCNTMATGIYTRNSTTTCY